MEIGGSPQECNAAHNFVNAFLASARCEPVFPKMGS